jgi:glycosyltransferase involved in cell wall biosynthesis
MAVFSIVLPTYNRASFIRKAVDSVIAQIYSEWELIIVDDASIDNTVDLLRQYNDSRIRIIKNEVNMERSASRNKGIEAAKGEYICFLDSDDYYLPNHLDTLYHRIQSLSHPVALIHTDVSVRDVNDYEIRQINYTYSSILSKTEWVLSNHIQPNSVAIHYTIFGQFIFDSGLSVNEDVYLFAQIASVYPVFHVPQPTVAWVMHAGNTTHQLHNYLTPQLLATRTIFGDANIKVSKTFKKNKYFELYSQLVYFYASRKKAILSMVYFVRAMQMSPYNKDNITNALNVIYHLPGGNWIKKTVRIFHR